MAESILSRVSRLLSARVEDVVDTMERAGGDAVMREAIREVDRAMDQIRSEKDVAGSRRLQAARQQTMLAERVAQLGEKAQFAIAEGREDLAKAALSRQIDFEAQADGLARTQLEAGEEEARLEAGLAALKARKQQMDDALAAFVASRRDMSGGTDAPAQASRSVEHRVQRAEQAFDRAMAGVGGVGMTRADADTIKGVTEIDQLQRQSAVSQRLAALKQAKAG